MTQRLEARDQALRAAGDLFYARGIHAVGMDDVRAASGVSLKTLYKHYPSKDALVVEFLRARDERWLRELRDHVEQRPASERLVAVFDWLHEWFSEPTYRGCAFLNSFGELGATSPAVAQLARRHKQAFRDYLGRLAEEAGQPTHAAEAAFLLAEGAMAASAVLGRPDLAETARETLSTLTYAAEPAPEVT